MNESYFNSSWRNSATVEKGEDAMFIYHYGIFGLITLINLPGNLLVIVTFLRHDSLREPCNYFIISLAVNDFLTGILYPTYNAAHINDVNIQTVLGDYRVCLFLTVEINALWAGSSYHLVAITLTRFLCIVNPLRYHDYITKTKSLISIATIWTVCHVISASMFGGYEKPDNYKNDCRFEILFTPAHTHALFVMNFFIPILTMLGLYMKVIKIARKQAKVMAVQEAVAQAGSVNEGIVSRDLKAAVLVAFLLLCFCVAWIPLTTYFYIQTGCGGCINSPFLRATVRILLFLNSATNVFVYAGRFAPFRNAVKKDFKYLCRRCTESNG